MVDYPTTKIKKALAQRGDSSAEKTAWQELMERHNTVPSTQALQAPDVIKGFSGSWAASYELGDSIRNTDQGESPAPVQLRTNRLGQPGMAEINFRPYDYGTTRHGKYGPSLVGHPISFEVVGPTLKNRDCVHQWIVDASGSADVLALDAVTALSTTTSEVALPATQNSMAEIYNLAAIPNGGLYLVVSMTGSPGTITDGIGGVGDGQIGDSTIALVPPRAAIVPTTESSKYEIFRVTSFTTTSVTLDSSKRLSDYFTFNSATGTPVIRAVTLIKPAATRLVAVPGSGARGLEKVFAFVPPKVALTDDMRPVYTSWLSLGRFDPWTCGPDMATMIAPGGVGVPTYYPQDYALPVPNPVAKGFGRLQGINGEATTILGMSQVLVVSDALDTSFSTLNIGKILRIFDVRRVGDGTWATGTSEGAPYEGDASEDRLLGYFEIMDAGVWGALGAHYYSLRAVSQFDPETGVPFYFNGDLTRMATGSAAGQSVNLQWTLHDPIETLWTDAYLNPAKLESARLKNLIDPRWARPSLKARSGAAFGHPSLPDRAAFSTATSNGGAPGSNANPGNLMDLGFRVVLYPALDTGTDLIPDFDHPVDCNEVIIDPFSTDTNQFIEVDYSAGLVTLSHAPYQEGQLLRDTAIWGNPSNPRNEMVIFASCVPFSQEPGQMGANPRVTGGITPTTDNNSCETPEQADAFGGRVYWPATTQTLTSGTQQSIRLDVQLSPIDIPPTGFVDVVLGTTPAGAPAFTSVAGEDRICTFGYTQVDYDNGGGGTTLTGTFGGAVSASTYGIVAGVTPATVVLRKNIVTPNTLDGTAGTDYRFDTTYGFAKRSEAIRFKHGTITSETDGSLTIDVTNPKTEAQEDLFGDLFSSWCLSGGVMTTVLPATKLDFTACTVLIAGVRSVLPAQRVTPSYSSSLYIYIDGTNPNCPVYATTATLALPSSNDVLIGRYTASAPNVLTYFDLRQPLADMDKRLDITVGAPTGHAQPGTAHFSELADAIQFVAETMDPVGAGGGGDYGQFRRIKVIGPTLEDATKLPIAYPDISGIIIEGAGWPQDGTAVAPRGIQWDDKTVALFDLSDCSGWVFRDLVFRSPVTWEPTNIWGKTLFVVETGSAEDILFENILLQGYAHGFLYVYTSAADYDRITLRNCIATDLTDFAVLVGSTVTASYGLRIENCHFEVEKGVLREVAALTDTGIIHIGDSDTDETHIFDTTLIGGQVGIVVFGDRVWIDNCQISDTETAGIWLNQPDFGAIRSCSLALVHTTLGTSGPATPAKSGIYMYRPDQISVLNNGVTLSGGTAGDQAIYMETTAGQANKISGNETDYDIDTQGDTVIRDNTITAGGITVIGDDSVVSGNDCPAGLAVTGDNNRLDHNYSSAGTLSITGDDNLCTSFMSDASVGGIWGANNRLVSSRFDDTFVVSGADNVLIGNDLTSILINGSRLIVKGNTLSGYIFSGGESGTNAPNSIISDNEVGSYIEIGKGSDDCIISNNRCVGQIATAQAVIGAILEVRVADRPQILGNLASKVVCAWYDPAATNLEGDASDSPMIHNNRLVGDIICAYYDGAAVHYDCFEPSIQGNIGHTTNTDIAVGAGYLIIGNRAANIIRAIGEPGGTDPDIAAGGGGIVMGNKIATNIFVVPTAASGWDTNTDDNAVSGGDVSTGFAKTGNST